MSTRARLLRSRFDVYTSLHSHAVLNAPVERPVLSYANLRTLLSRQVGRFSLLCFRRAESHLPTNVNHVDGWTVSARRKPFGLASYWTSEERSCHTSNSLQEVQSSAHPLADKNQAESLVKTFASFDDAHCSFHDSEFEPRVASRPRSRRTRRWKSNRVQLLQVRL